MQMIFSNKNAELLYIRKMASTIKASPHDERELVLLSNRIPFDDRMNHATCLGSCPVSLLPVTDVLKKKQCRRKKDFGILLKKVRFRHKNAPRLTLEGKKIQKNQLF